MQRLLLVLLGLGASVAITRHALSTDLLDQYLPLKAAPEHHKTLLENGFVLVLDVSIPPGATVPAHLHPWPAVFITLEPAHLIFRNLSGDVVREVHPPAEPFGGPKVEWREPDTEPASVTNVGTNQQRALRVELKFLAR
ncbi:MAG TPA: hypothetical protein VHQ66_05150 [Myxococcota bacterium]|nr:hypothetical protein [Myxococcota bacterium]